MGRKAKYPIEEKVRVIKQYQAGEKGVLEISNELQISKDTFYCWLRKYRNYGIQGLQTISKNKSYTKELKLMAVTDYKNRIDSLRGICTKYEISSKTILQQWIKKYNNHEAYKSYNIQEGKFMIKGRKTTYEERTEIVAFCIANNDNYQMTAKRFQVSYQQIYSWIKKNKENGYEALIDNRGNRKSPVQLSETEKINAKMKLVEAENRRLKMENDFLKKLNEVERRG